MSGSRWIALHCGDDAVALLAKYPNAFLLHTQVAMRAKWKDCPITQLKAGEAFIGDWREAGLSSEKAYRRAKSVLEKCGLVAFQGTNKGTRATLTSASIYSLTPVPTGEQMGGQGANERRAEGGQGATNHTDTQKDGTLPPPPAGGMYPVIIEELWRIAPAKSRDRSSKKKAADAWAKTKGKPDADLLKASLGKWAMSDDWIRDGGQFAPGLHVWISGRKWESDPASSSQGSSNHQPKRAADLRL